MGIVNNALAGSSGQSSGYNLTNSLRFRSSASAYLNRTPASSGNLRLWTLSWWTKRGQLSTAAQTTMFGTDYASNQECQMQFTAGNKFVFEQYTAAGATFLGNLISTQVFRDPSAWYHIVVTWDSAQATASNRIKVYINGVQITAWDTASYPTQNADSVWNQSTNAHFIGKYSTAKFYDGYQTEINFIDGQALTPSSFGQTSATTGVWIPKKYTGTYGTNGFYLPFTDNSALTTSSNAGLGKDFSGNSNYWTTNNISITSGSTYDSMVDVPTLTSITQANYCVFNPLDRGSTNFTLSNGNLNIVGASASSAVRATMAVSSGKWYWEATPTAIGNGLGVGFAGDSSRFNPATWNAGTYVIYQSDGNKHINGSASSYGATYTTNDVIGVALDMDAGTITFYKNNVSQGTASTGLTGVYLPVFSQTSGATTGTINANFGAGSGFTYTPSTGFKALNTFNLPTPTIGATASTQANDYFNTVLYTGNGATFPSSQSITGVGFQPDFTWIKSRSNAYPNFVFDAVRGAGKELVTNDTAAETNKNQLTTFGSDGFSVAVATDGSLGTNGNGSTFVAWNWKANGSGSTNTAGSITSTVSANTTAGFSIVTYTGNGSGGATVGHGLGVAPKMVIVKRRDSGVGNTNWYVYNANLNNGVNPAQYYIFLNLTNAQGGASSVWNDTAPTSSVFSLGTSSETNGSGGTFVAYCFAQVAGYSAFGSYVGNGVADGPFIYTGFRPRYFILKNITSAQSWSVQDTSRSPYNVASAVLLPNSSSAELTGTDFIDIVSNGFKIRHSSSGNNNNSGDTYIYMAFAENPFKYSLAR